MSLCHQLAPQPKVSILLLTLSWRDHSSIPHRTGTHSKILYHLSKSHNQLSSLATFFCFPFCSSSVFLSIYIQLTQTRERQLRLYGHVARLPAEDPAHRILSCRDARGWTVPKERSQASCLRQLESYLRDMGIAGLASAWAIARRRPI